MANVVRTTIDLPQDVYERLRKVAAKRHTSMKALVVEHIVQGLDRTERPIRRVPFPLIRDMDHPIDLTNEQLYELADFP